MFDIQREELEWNGRTLVLETGRVARQADGAVVASYGDTTVLATVVAAKEPKPGIDFLPLTVNYQEKYYAAGRIPGGYFKREGRPTERETLISRLIDRPIRPLFVDGWRNDTQVIINVLSHDQENNPDILALVAASAALTLSGAPFMGPIGAARVGYINGEIVTNPTIDQMEESDLDLVVAGTGDAVLMVESEAKELSEEVMLKAVMAGHASFQPVIDAIIRLAEKAAKEPRAIEVKDNAELEGKVRELIEGDLRAAYQIVAKADRQDAVSAAKKKAIAALIVEGDENSPKPEVFGKVFKSLEAKIVRWSILDTGKRIDCRARTARPCLRVVKPRRWSLPPSAPAKTSSSSTRWKAPTRKPSFCTITSRPSRSAKPAVSVAQAAAKSATASLPGVPFIRFFRKSTSSPTRSASCRR
jgi:polyribonucleotide nucleotidyltransferase